MKFEDLTNPQLKKVIKTYRLHLLEGLTGYSSFNREKLITICKKFFDIDDEKIKPKVSEPIFFDIPPKPASRRRRVKEAMVKEEVDDLERDLKELKKKKKKKNIKKEVDDLERDLKELKKKKKQKKIGLTGGSGAASSFNFEKFEELKDEALKQKGKEDQTMQYIEYASPSDLDKLENWIETLILFNPDNDKTTKFDNLPISLQNIYIMHYDDGQGFPRPLDKMFPKLPFNCKVQRIVGSYHTLDFDEIKEEEGLDIDLNVKKWVQIFSKPPFNDDLAINAKKFGYTTIEENDDGTVYLWINYSLPETYYG